MSRKLDLYVGHESARMAELEGLPLASFWSRFVAFAIDFALAAFTFVPIGVAAAYALIKLGCLHDGIQVEFDPFHHEHWESLIYFVLFIALSNYIGNGATIGKKIMKIRAVSLVQHGYRCGIRLSVRWATVPPHWRHASDSSSTLSTRHIAPSMTASPRPSSSPSASHATDTP